MDCLEGSQHQLVEQTQTHPWGLARAHEGTIETTFDIVRDVSFKCRPIESLSHDSIHLITGHVSGGGEIMVGDQDQHVEALRNHEYTLCVDGVWALKVEETPDVLKPSCPTFKLHLLDNGGILRTVEVS